MRLYVNLYTEIPAGVNAADYVWRRRFYTGEAFTSKQKAIEEGQRDPFYFTTLVFDPVKDNAESECFADDFEDMQIKS